VEVSELDLNRHRSSPHAGGLAIVPDLVHQRTKFGSHTRHPSEDFNADGKYIGDQVSAVVAASGTSDDPQGYGQIVARELFPDLLL
jgi:hypothetical protein